MSKVIKEYVGSFYQDVDKKVFTKKIISDTYGEILFEGIEKIVAKLALNSQDVIYDLGSGLGKPLLQIALQQEVQQLCGIEYNADLHFTAQATLKRFLYEAAKIIKTKELNLIHGDFLRIPFSDATIVFILSTCFSHPMLEKLADKINQLEKIRYVISLKALPNLNLSFKKSFRVECTWDSALCYLYSS